MGERLYRWVFLFLIHSPIVAADAYDFLNSGYTIEQTKIVAKGFLSPQVPNFAQIQRDQSQFHSLTEFFDYLFAQAPSLKDRFVLISHSQSQQLSSPEFPRVLLYGGGMVFSASEHPGNRESRVEILELDPVSYKISLKEIRFADGKAEFHSNPKSCAACHGLSPKPLWAPYDFWPTAFGSVLGTLSTDREAEAYHRLVAGAPNSPLLSRLNLMPTLKLDSENNTAFTQYIAQLNLARWLKNSFPEKIEASKTYPLLSVLNGCGMNFSASEETLTQNVLQFFREDERAKVLSRYQSIRAETGLAKTHFDNYQDKQLLRNFPDSKTTFPIDHNRMQSEPWSNAMIRTLLDLANVDASDLSANHTGSDYGISTPSNIAIDLLTALYDVRPEIFNGLDKEDFDLARIGRNTSIHLNCDQLQAKSLAAERDLNTPSHFVGYKSINKARPVISRCSKCHSEGMSSHAPAIPFDNSLAFANQLRDTSKRLGARIMEQVRAGTMPPGQPLTPEEIESLEAYLTVLK